ncbi:MAG: [protein-PII] uridylyltransferase [Candidatus Hydrogenedentes bacterium]|nr:[protein-PII] uridylyltransferase [Candidatus Hydrogenedentota bacterium]
MSARFEELVALASKDVDAFRKTDRNECVAAARIHLKESLEAIRKRHTEGESGSNVVRLLTKSADDILRGVFHFALAQVGNPRQVLSRLSLCALGGYGRRELSPYSDLDVCLLFEGRIDSHIEKLNGYLVPFLWDMGFAVGYGIRSIDDTMTLIRDDVRVYTSFLEGRLIAGDNTAFGRLKLFVQDWRSRDRSDAFIQLRVRERRGGLPEEYRDLYRPEPNIKENAGGLRDFQTALWLLMSVCGTANLDEVAGQGLISAEEHLDLIKGLDFVWRIRNELHFSTGREEDRLTFEHQKHVARAFGYGGSEHEAVARLMEDYYAAARKLRRFLHTAVAVCDSSASGMADIEPQIPDYTIQGDELHVGLADEHWFQENPVRFMEAYWECARYGLRLSRPTERRILKNLNLIGDTFRSSDVVRRFFVAICGRTKQAGAVLRQMANTGVLGRYMPEFAAIQGLIRYEDFHHYPVDEHTLRAIEALAKLDDMTGSPAESLRAALGKLSDPHILAMAILMHDLGKAASGEHVEEGAILAHQICQRTGMPEEDEERIVFLVQHHMLMTTISQYRDTDDEDIVRSFANTVKTSERLRALYLLSYCDLSAVGPDVWSDWKGTLLKKLYVAAERALLGDAQAENEAYWESRKADEIRELVRRDLGPRVEEHIRGLGERYFQAFSTREIALHVECVAEAKETGLSIHSATDEVTGKSRIVVSTRDCHGLFSKIAGCFASQLVDINSAALFTRPDGFVVDCFIVAEASGRRPLTHEETAGIERVLRVVLLKGDDVQPYVERSRTRLFALLQPRVSTHTRIDFDNDSSRTYTVIDVQTADHTGLLYDITHAMAEADLDISTARIVTDARQVHDSFYVTMEQQKLMEKGQQDAVRERLRKAIHPRALAETGGNVP